MKFTAAFLVLFLLVLMPAPAEGFLGMLIHGIVHVGKTIHGLIHGHHVDLQEVQLEKRSLTYHPGRPIFN